MKKIFILALIAIFVISSQANAQQSSGIFKIISVSKDSVKFKTLAETKLYSVSLKSGTQFVAAKRFSNSVGTVRWANGSLFCSGSSMSMPASYGVDAMILPKGAVLTVFFKTPDTFTPSNILFMTEEGANAISLPYTNGSSTLKK
ncbi:MAG: hypothetical protein LBN95_05420 [Prevotellaceae bacterium]|jgi:hypothetical protein|nr:hypothetical protein [Prevotellaceae bacterium]